MCESDSGGVERNAQIPEIFIYLFIFWLCWVFVAACRLSLAVACRLLIVVAFLAVEHRLQGLRASVIVVDSVVAAPGLSSCGAWVQLLLSMWNLPGPGIKRVSPALAGGFFTTGPPGESLYNI